MQNTTTYEFGDVVLVPFPLADYRGLTKQRPAVVISEDQYNAEGIVLSATEHYDLIIVMGVTSVEEAIGAVTIKQWREAGLLYPSSIKPIIATLSAARVVKKLGKLELADKNSLKKAIVRVLNLTPSSTSPARPS